MLKVKQFVFNPFGESTYVVTDEATLESIVVDPGMATEAEQRRLDEYIESNSLKITGVVNTHLHLDHCFGANHVRDRYGVPVRAHAADAPLGASLAAQMRRFGMVAGPSGEAVTIDAPLADGDVITLGHEHLRVLHVPGHSPGGIALYSPDGHFVLAGDSLFAGSIGRTDLEGGDYATLVDAVRRKLLTLPPDTLVLPGHGPATTVADELHSNPFVR